MVGAQIMYDCHCKQYLGKWEASQSNRDYSLLLPIYRMVAHDGLSGLALSSQTIMHHFQDQKL